MNQPNTSPANPTQVRPSESRPLGRCHFHALLTSYWFSAPKARPWAAHKGKRRASLFLRSACDELIEASIKWSRNTVGKIHTGGGSEVPGPEREKVCYLEPRNFPEKTDLYPSPQSRATIYRNANLGAVAQGIRNLPCPL